MQITPAILPAHFEELHDNLFRLEGVTGRVQIDLCDGRMGLEKTWLPYKETHLPDGFEYEFDLMVNEWQKFLPRVLTLGAKRVVMHVDGWEDHDFKMLYDMMRHHIDVTVGFSVTNDAPIEMLCDRVFEAKQRLNGVFVQLMGIKKIGAQGQPFDERVLSRIDFVRRACHGTLIQIDGGMNPETIFLVKRSGAACAVVGSYIFGSGNIRKTIDSLQLSFGE
jgi:ribulose-phosphate 3-epimerase